MYSGSNTFILITVNPKPRRLRRCSCDLETKSRSSEIEGGFPHSEIRGSKLVRSSPRLIAAYHVLHRLSAPRHPPNTLKTLDRSHYQCPSRSAAGSDRLSDSHVLPTHALSRHDQKDQFCFEHTRDSRGQAVLTDWHCRALQSATTNVMPTRADVADTDDVSSLRCQNQSSRTAIRRRVERDFRCQTNLIEAIGRSALAIMQPIWWSQTGSNRRPHACKARALPTELWPRSLTAITMPEHASEQGMVGLGRLELPTSRLSSARSNQLSYKPDRCTADHAADAG